MGQLSGLRRTAAPTALRQQGQRARADRVGSQDSGRRHVPTVIAVAGRALPWLLAVGLVGSYLVAHDTPVGDVVRYAVYLTAGVVLPGTLLVRALHPGPQAHPTVDEVAVGAAAGLVAQLVALVVAVLAGQPSWARWWPLLVVLGSVLLPWARTRCWRTGDPSPAVEPAPVWWHWGVAGAAAVGGVLALRPFLDFPVPPGEGVHHVDLPWHLALVHAVTRSVPPEVPQVAGHTTEYHWFANGDMAAASVVSGVPEAVVLLRLWPVAIVGAGVLLVSVLARTLSGGWAAGLVAAWICAALRGIQVLPVHLAETPVVPLSPSHGYAAVLTVAALVVVVRALRGEPVRPGGWVVLTALLAAAGGGKPAVLPTVACGAALSAAVGFGLLRRRQPTRAALGLLLACLALLPLTATMFSGSDSTSTLRLFAFMELHPMFPQVTGSAATPVSGPLLPDGVADLGARSAQILVLMLLALAFSHLGLALGAVALASPTVRQDPATWFLAGMLASSFAAYLVLAHPAYSQVYFVRLALTYGAAVQAWVLVGAVRRLHVAPVTGLALVLGGAAAGSALAWLTGRLVPALDRVEAASLLAWRSSFAWSLLVFVGGLAGVVAVLVLTGRRAGPPAWVAATVVSAALVVGAPAYAVRDRAVDPVVAALRGTPVPTVLTPRGRNDTPLPRGGGAAMAWLEAHTPRDAVVATNRHCSRGTLERACASNLHMVSGLGGRQTILESWAYVGVLGGPTRPDPYPARRAANDALFTHPTAEGFARMKREHRLSWLVADSTATPISPDITAHATARFSAGTVTVYEVR